MERESERERENENGQTSFSMQISTKYGSGNKRITKTMLQELIRERLRQRQTTESELDSLDLCSIPISLVSFKTGPLLREFLKP
jgi:hypothetical protein